MQLNEVLVRPVLTEKGVQMANKQTYLFEVHTRSNKDQIREALEAMYEVQVKDIKVMIRKGKERRVGRKMMIKRTPDKKIAVITLTKGKIGLFPQG